MPFPTPPRWATDALRDGLVIPAHPLALTHDGQFDDVRQRALTRYYHAAGAGGVAVGVHTTQFELRDHNLYRPVLQLAAQTATEADMQTGRRMVLVAGLCGTTRQATDEAKVAEKLGYHAGLLSLAGWRDASQTALLRHCEAVARILPLFGFYLQPAVGGVELPYSFWQRFVEIPNVVAIKVAPFNRYQTLDVVRAVAEVGREDEIALYTGNDDNIIADLLTTYAIETRHGTVRLGFVGGLLGHWACWTRRAVEHLDACKRARRNRSVSVDLLTLAAQVTEANAALFDAEYGFAGCRAGIHAVLQRQGLLTSARLLNPRETLSTGQADALDRIHRAYPHLHDDAFVTAHLDEWLW